MLAPSPPLPKRVLIVDNERMVADTLVLVAQGHGFEATACYNGQEAIEQALIYKPDLLLTDYDMPYLNGFDAALQVSASHPRCRVVFLSSIPAPLEISKRLAEAVEYATWITKPVHPSVLLREMDRALAPQHRPSPEVG